MPGRAADYSRVQEDKARKIGRKSTLPDLTACNILDHRVPTTEQ